MGNRIKLKVLPLESWMNNDNLDNRDKDDTNFWNSFIPIKPIFKRNGLYKTQDLCWFELDGAAHLFEAKDFNYLLKSYNHVPLRDIEYKHLQALNATGFKMRDLKDVFFEEEHYRHLRKFHQDTVKSMMSCFK